MIGVGLYFILLLLIAILGTIKSSNILGRILYWLYSAIGLCAVIAINDGTLNSKQLIIPYLYLILVYVIYFSPFMKRNADFSVSKLNIRVNNRYVAFLVVYILCTIITIKCFLPSILTLIASGNWSMNRYSLYLGEMTFPYSNTFELIAMNVTDYFRLMTLIVSFAILREENVQKTKYIVAFSGIISAVASMLCSAIYTSSRGSVVNTFILVIALYCFFQNDFEKNKKRYFITIASLGIAAVVPYLLEVTISRFTTGANSAVISYFGQAPIVFSSGVWDINKYMYGDFAFGKLFGHSSFSEASIGGTWDNGFYTFVGWIFIDWGPIGVLILGALLVLIINSFMRKQEYLISDVYLMMFYYSTLLQGVFVIGRSYCYTMVVSFVIYVIFKVFFDKYKFKIGRIMID